MMDCIRTAIGEDLVMGKKFPREGLEEVERSEIRQYLFEKGREAREKAQAEVRDMNPNGFWECQYTVQGIRYHWSKVKGLSEIDGKVCKIVSQGIAQSDPRYIDRIIYMLRDPHQVAKSQEKLRGRGPRLGGKDKPKHHGPEMFIRVTTMFANWMIANPDVPVLVVNFDDLISDPHQWLGKVRDFYSPSHDEYFTDWGAACGKIEPKLKRSKPTENTSKLWEDADAIYEMAGKKDWEGIVSYMADKSRETHVQAKKWTCTRLEQIVIKAQCEQCISNTTVAGNFRMQAEKNEVNWSNEPCVYECGITGKPGKSVAESIADNHWCESVKPSQIDHMTWEESQAALINGGCCDPVQ